MRTLLRKTVFLLVEGVRYQQSFFPIDLVNYFKETSKKVVFDQFGLIRFTFVGVLILEEYQIFCFPKHYDIEFKKTTADNLKSSDVENIQVLFKWIGESQKVGEASGEMELDNDAQNFPLINLLEVVDYYKKNGLYFEQEKKFSNIKNPPISWPKTFQNCIPFVEENQVVYSEYVHISSTRKSNVVTSFMIDALKDYINYIGIYTHDVFHLPLSNNEDKNIMTLVQYRKTVFSDSSKNLIDNLILYFQSKNIMSQFSHWYISSDFEYIWEILVKKSLEEKLIFENALTDYSCFEQKPKHHLGERLGDKGFVDIDIFPDFIIEREDCKYIIDAKYYAEKRGIDYKQLIYSLKLQDSSKKIKSFLVLPTKKNISTSLHFNGVIAGHHVIVYEIYLPVKKMMDELKF